MDTIESKRPWFRSHKCYTKAYVSFQQDYPLLRTQVKAKRGRNRIKAKNEKNQMDATPYRKR
jgi:hypothetical protein